MHFVEVTILVRNMTDDIVTALSKGGYNDIEEVALMTTGDVGRLVLRDVTSGVETPLDGKAKRVWNVALLFFCETNVDVYDHTSFMALMTTDWQNFNRAQRLASRNTGASGSSSATGGAPAPPAPSTSNSYKPVDSFKRGIKRDTSAFPTLNDENNQDQWHQDMQVQACAQGVDNVLDATYTPASTKETELFAEKNKFV